jgi:hypothetical protein
LTRHFYRYSLPWVTDVLDAQWRRPINCQAPGMVGVPLQLPPLRRRGPAGHRQGRGAGSSRASSSKRWRRSGRRCRRWLGQVLERELVGPDRSPIEILHYVPPCHRPGWPAVAPPGPACGRCGTACLPGWFRRPR